jgi:hypothetical protein
MRFLRNKTHSAAEYNRFFEDTKHDATENDISLSEFDCDDSEINIVESVCKKDRCSDAVTVDIPKKASGEQETLLLSETLHRIAT